jgi:hypothetical protein
MLELVGWEGVSKKVLVGEDGRGLHVLGVEIFLR